MTNNITNEQIINAIDNGCTKELRALEKGMEIQLSYRVLKNNDWVTCNESNPANFTKSCKYRVKPVEKTRTSYLVRFPDGSVETVDQKEKITDGYNQIMETHTFTYTEEE